jgi:hypothetical protein
MKPFASPRAPDSGALRRRGGEAMTSVRKWSFWVLTLLALASAGCAVTANLRNNSVRPPTHMIATPIPRTLYIVMAPDDVQDAFPIRNSPHSVVAFRQFFGDALSRTLRPHFRSVEVVSVAPAPGTPAVIADVRVDGVEARDLPVGSLVYTTLVIQWALGVRLSESTDYAFSFAGNGASDHAYRTLGEGFEQMTLSAMNGLVQEWTDRNVFPGLAAAARAAGTETEPQAIGSVESGTAPAW